MSSTLNDFFNQILPEPYFLSNRQTNKRLATITHPCNNSGKGSDTRHCHNKVELRKILLSSCQNQRLQIGLAHFKAVHVRADDVELFSLFGAHLSVYSSKDVLVRSFHSLRSENRNICNFLGWIFKKPFRNCRSGLSKHVRKYIIQLNIGDGQTVLCSVFLAGSEVGELPTITYQIPKLANISRRDKAAGNKDEL